MAGVGEFVGYALRIVFGYLSDRALLWPITLWGYGLTFVAVPLLALAGSWQATRFTEAPIKEFSPMPRGLLGPGASEQIGVNAAGLGCSEVRASLTVPPLFLAPMMRQITLIKKSTFDKRGCVRDQ